MSRIGAGFSILLSVGLAACHKEASLPTINASMTGVMEPKGQKIWDIASNAYNDIGDGLVPAKITAKDWAELEEASRTLRDRAKLYADADVKNVRVADPNEPVLGSQAVGVKGNVGKDWDAVDASTIQARIHADPSLFKKKAQALVETADAIHRAAQTKDASLFYKHASGMDEVCDGCHEPFWGTDEPPAVLHGVIQKATSG